MPKIPPADGPFEAYFHFRMRRQTELFRHGSRPSDDPMDEVVENLDRQARLERSLEPDGPVDRLELGAAEGSETAAAGDAFRVMMIANLASLGLTADKICQVLRIQRSQVHQALSYYRSAAPDAPPPPRDEGPEEGSVDTSA